MLNAIGGCGRSRRAVSGHGFRGLGVSPAPAPSAILSSPAGSANYEAGLTGVAGVRAELFVHGEFVATLPCKDGKAAAAFDSRLGDPAIKLKAGDLVEIRQNGCVVLAGALK